MDYFKFFRDSFLVVAANDLTFLVVREKAELRHSHNGTVRAGSGEKRVENAVHFKRGKPQRIFLIVINGVFIAAAGRNAENYTGSRAAQNDDAQNYGYDFSRQTFCQIIFYVSEKTHLVCSFFILRIYFCVFNRLRRKFTALFRLLFRS